MRKIGRQLVSVFLVVALLMTGVDYTGLVVCAAESVVEMEETEQGETEEIAEETEPEQSEALEEIVDEVETESAEESEVVDSEESETVRKTEEEVEAEEIGKEATEKELITTEEVLKEGEVLLGKCGDNLTWTLADGTLTISGTGEMNTSPWKSYLSQEGVNVNLIMEEGITTITHDAFKGCLGLTGELVIPDSITKIGFEAFCYCDGLTGSLTIPDSVTEIGGRAFYQCSGFNGNLKISNNVITIEERVFYGCCFSGDLTIGNSVTKIGYQAFSGNKFSGELIIPDNVTEIGNSAFSDCSGFTGELVIPSNVVKIGGWAFSRCSGLSGSLTIPDGISCIEEYTFSQCSGFTGTLVIPNSVTSIGRNAFHGCSGLTGNLIIPDNIISIGEEAFINCSGFTGTLTIPNSITSIEEEVFCGCSGLSSLVISDSVTNIDLWAFNGCSGLRKVCFIGNAPQISDNLSFGRVTAKVYYPSNTDGWENVADRDYGGTLTWIPYPPGTKPWLEDDSNEGTPHIWPSIDSDLSDLHYDIESGYDKDEFKLDITAYFMGMLYDIERYEDVNIVVELPQGLSFSKDEEENTRTSILEIMDSNTNNIYKESYPVYITADNMVDKFEIIAKVTAKNYKTPQTYTYSISVLTFVFNASIYRADKLHDTSNPTSQSMMQIIDQSTPNDIMIAELQKNGFDDQAATWKDLELLLDTLDDVTNLYDFAVEEKDLYSAIILDSLEVSTKINVADSCSKAIKAPKDLLSEITRWAKIEYKMDIADEINFQNLNAEQQEKLDNLVENFFKSYYDKDLQSLNKVFKNIGTFFKHADNIETYVERVCAIFEMANLCESMKTVIRTMYDNCPDSNLALKYALWDCKEIIDSTTEQLIDRVILEGLIDVVGVNIAKYLIGEMWKEVKKTLNSGYPVLDGILAGYKAGKFISNTLFNTDDTVEQYYKMLAVSELESVMDKTYEELDRLYIKSKTEEKAAAYLSSIDLLFSMRDQDCVSAYGFVDALDEALVNKVADAFAKWILGTGDSSSDKLKKSISSIQQSYSLMYEAVLTFWIYELDDDYPGKGLGEQYQQYLEEIRNKTLKKEYLIACPVDVYVYDSNDNLAAYVENNTPHCNGNMTVAVSGDQKLFYFYDDDEYRMECVGNASGTMDITISEFDQEEKKTRSVYFYDLPLQKQKSYETMVDGKIQNTASYSFKEENGTTISPDFDTQAQGNDTATYKLGINSGFIVVDDILMGEAKLRENQTVELRAYVANGYTFAGWVADQESVVFTDVNEQITTMRMPKADVVVTALLRDVNGTIIDPSKEHKDKTGFTVTFDTQNYGTAPSAYTGINAGSFIEPPQEPTAEHYIFLGWFKDAACTVPWDFSTDTVESDITLYAGWKEDSDDSDSNLDDDFEGVLPEDIPADGIPQGLWIAGVKDYIYTGKAIKQEVRVYDGEKRLKEKTDYTISYKNNTKANNASAEKTAPTIVVKGKGNYGGTETAVFKILPVDLNDTNVTVDDITLAFNNKVQKPVPTIIYNGKKLKNNTDFIVSYPELESSNPNALKEVGTYSLVISAKKDAKGNDTGNFIGTRTLTFDITDRILIGKVAVKKIPNQTYTGTTIEPQLQVTYKNDVLTQGTDYEVSYLNNTEIGTATVILTGINQYAGTKKVTYRIIGKSIKNAVVSAIENITYDGTAKYPKPQVSMDGAILKEGTDYKITWQNNVNAGNATITLSGIKKYSGTLKKTFRITAYDLQRDIQNKISGFNSEITEKYAKGGSRPDIELVFNGTKLTVGKDYTISYKNNKQVAPRTSEKPPTIVITGKGNFKGKLSKTFTVTQKALDDVDVPVSFTVADVGFVDKAGKYISKPILTDIDGKRLVAGVDYEKDILYTLTDGTILTKEDKVEAGREIILKVTGKGAYTGELTKTYRITKSDFSKAKIVIQTQTYTGTAITLDASDITVKIGDTTLTYGVDYEILSGSYANNIKKGNASVTIVGKGSYGGTKTVKFKIAAKKVSWFWRLFG